MNRVQELIDASRDALPTQLAKDLLDACKEEYDASPALYRVRYTELMAAPEGEDSSTTILHAQKAAIVEAVSSDEYNSSILAELLPQGHIAMRWLEKDRPFTVSTCTFGQPGAFVIHSITPFPPARRPPPP